MHYERVLVAVDLAADSAAVIARARAIAAPLGELSLVHVMEPFPIGYMNKATFDTLTAAIQGHCRKALLELGTLARIDKARLHNRVGSPDEEIHRLALELAADLVVVGGHGTHGFELLHGSTSTRVTHGAPCDLLIVHIRG